MTAAGGGGANLNANVRIAANFQELKKASDSVEGMKARLAEMAKSLEGVDSKTLAYNKRLAAQLDVFTKSSAAVLSYVKATDALASSTVKSTDRAKAYAQALADIDKALKASPAGKKNGPGTVDEKAVKNTLDLYKKLAEVSRTRAQTVLAEATSIERLAKAELALAKARGQGDAGKAASAKADRQAAQAAKVAANAQQKAAEDQLRQLQSLGTARGKNESQIERQRQAEAKLAVSAAATGQQRIAILDKEQARRAAVLGQLQREAVALEKVATAANRKATQPGATPAQIAAAVQAESQYQSMLQRVSRATNDLSTASRQLDSEIQKLSKTTRDASRDQDTFGTSMNSTRYALYEVAAAYTAVATAGAKLLGLPVRIAASYEDAFADVARTSQLASEPLEVLRNQLIDMTTEIPKSFEELSGIASLGAQLGIPGNSIAAFTDTVAKFASVSDVSAETATMLFGRLQNLGNIQPTADNFRKLGSAVAELGVNSVATESEILNVSQAIAASTTAAGFSTEATLGYATALASLKVPPEMARGAMQRVLFLIQKAMSEGGDKAKAFGAALNISGQAAQDLYKANPEQFFTSLITAIGKTTQSGGDYVKLLGDLGIKNTRDVITVQRLAGSYNLLGDSIQQAYDSYGSGTFLDETAAVRFETLQKQFTEFQSSLKNLGDAFGRPLLAPLTAFVEMLTAAVDGIRGFLNTGLGSFLGVVALGFVGVITAFAAYRAVTATAIAGTIAFRAVQQSQLVQNSGQRIGLGLLITAWRGSQVAQDGATAAAARNVAATNVQTAALARQTGVLAGNTAARGVNAAAGTAAGGAGVLATVGKFAKSLPGVGLIVGLGAAIVSLVSSTSDSEKAAAEAAIQFQNYKESLLAAGGGASSLREAIDADTKAWKSNASGFTTVTTQQSLAADGAVNYATTLRNANGEVQDFGSGVKTASNATLQQNEELSKAITNQSTTAEQVRATNRDLSAQTLALGESTIAWQKNALAQKIISAPTTGEGALTPEQKQQFIDNGAEIQALIEEGVKDGYPKLLNRLQTQYDEILARRKSSDARFLAEAEALRKQRENGVIYEDDPELVALRAKYKAEAEADDAAIAKRKLTLELMKGLASQIQDVQLRNQIITAIGAADTAVDDSATSFEEAGDAVKEYQDQLSAAADAVSAYADEAFKLTNLNADIGKSFYDLGTSLVENGTSFDIYTEAGVSNLNALQGVVASYGAELSSAVEQGTITAGDAADRMQAYILDLQQRLESAGVDTSQLQFLNDYINQLVNQPRVVTIEADTNPIIGSIIDVYNRLATLSSGALLTPAASAPSVGDPQTRFDAGQYYARYEAEYAAQQEAAQAAQQASRETQQQERAAAAEQREQERAARAGEKEERSAEKAQRDAAKQREAELQAEIAYVNELAGFYSSLGGTALGAQQAQAGVFSALQDLGQSLAENGTAFNTFSDGGRANLAALETALNGYGEQLSYAVQNTGLSAADASAKFKQFAGGVYAELLRAGASAKDLGAIFAGIGTGPNSFANQGADLAQFAGYIEAARQAEIKYGEGSSAAAKKVEEARQKIIDQLQQEKDYLAAIGDYYANMATTVFSFADAQGATFAGLQALGAGLIENGKNFNVVTAGGRANLANLRTTLEAFGKTLQQKVTAGTISAGEATKQMSQFAGGLRQELIRMGVPAKDIDGYFKAMGYSAEGFANSADNVAQYEGTLTNAAKAAQAAATATAVLAAKLEIAADWANRLREAFGKSDTRKFGLQQAKDAATSAGQAMKDAFQGAIDKVKELRDANDKLRADLKTQEATANQANIEYLISKKYGETDRAKDYEAQRDAARADVKTTKDQIKANDKEIKTNEEGQGVLKGNTAAAIANRSAVIGLLGTYEDQIAAYAATGASAAQVATYTEQLRKQFIDTAKAAGITTKDLEPYTKQFDSYVQTIKNTPRVVTTTVNADTDAAKAAMDALPNSTSFTIVGKADLEAAKNDLLHLPKRSDFVVKPDVNVDPVLRQIARIPTTKKLTVSAVVGQDQVNRQMSKIPSKKPVDVQASVSAGTQARLTSQVGSGITNGGRGYTPPVKTPRKYTQAEIESMFSAIRTAKLIAEKLTFGVLSATTGVSSPALEIKEIYTTAAGGGRTKFAVATGGMMRSSGVTALARGGLIGGKPPRNPKVDNIGPVLGPGGKQFAIRSGEYMQPQPAVDYYGVGFMNAIRTRAFPRSLVAALMGNMQGLAMGGSVSGGGSSSSSGSGSVGAAVGAMTVIAQLSPEDRAMFREAANRDIVLFSNDKLIAESANRGNGGLFAVGSN